ncbi:TPA: ATP-binding protein [Vibrio parahaemolyticus]|nr:ATP-binding protein [Vibrio parahaemolyticus]HCG7751103.1 ATP-binding protein [Vibrio parahaemolyticus]
MSIIQHCQPRKDIIAGTFNPEIFTANLRQILNDYAKGTVSSPIYSDPEVFFREATFPTAGMLEVVKTVFGRLSGDNSFPVVRRLETAFGGGKTHTLIALTHLAKCGNSISDAAKEVIEPSLLLNKDEVSLVGVSGEALQVHYQEGTKLNTYTLWGEIAKQLGGEALYNDMKPLLESPSAPGADDPYFERVFGDKKALIIIDEIAVYAARSEAAHPGSGEQVAAFLMALLNYAKTRSHLSIVITLASDTNTFGHFNQQVRKSMDAARGDQLDDIEVERINQQTHKAVLDVLNRDAEGVSPVTGPELSKVMAKRLFEYIDPKAAEETAEIYLDMYRKAGSDLPAGAQQDDYAKAIAAHYPFHPTFMAYLTNKLAQVQSFQGTRGVLRTLARVIRNAWNKKLDVPLLHTGHVDLSDDLIQTEILGKTDNTDMKYVLQADVSQTEGQNIAAEKTAAQILDEKNKHPKGYPMMEWTWRTVFLHSLVGREDGLESDRYGIFEAEAMLESAMPSMPPSQVKSALELVRSEANYLREKEGRFFADKKPTLNNVLKRIRENVKEEERLNKLREIARSMVKEGLFQVARDVTEAAHIPDKTTKPVLAMVDFSLGKFEPNSWITQSAAGARVHQNYVFILSPSMVQAEGDVWDAVKVETETHHRRDLMDLAARVIADDRLNADPDRYGVTPSSIRADDYQDDTRSRALGLQTRIEQSYNMLYYPGQGGVKSRRIRSAGGEGGKHLMDLIFNALKEEGELITQEQATAKETLMVMAQQYFFTNGVTPKIQQIKSNFASLRHWPILENVTLLELMIREGINYATWCLFRMDEPSATEPEEIYHRENTAPMNLNLSQGTWYLISEKEAKKRGWIKGVMDKAVLKNAVLDAIVEREEADVEAVATAVETKHGHQDKAQVAEVTQELLAEDKLVAVPIDHNGDDAPAEVITANDVILKPFNSDTHKVVTKAEAVRRGWLTQQTNEFTNQHFDGDTVKKVLGAMKSLRGLVAHDDMTIDNFNVNAQLKGGGSLMINLDGVPVSVAKNLDELFQVILNVCDPQEGHADASYTLSGHKNDDKLIQYLKGLGSEE